MEVNLHTNDPLFAPFECRLFDSEKVAFPIRMHWHYFVEIILVKSGVLKVLRGGSVYMLRAGEVLLITPLVHHMLEKGDANQPVVYEMIKLDMEQLGELPSYTPDLRSMMLEAERRQISMHFPAKDVREYHMDFMVDQCVEEYRTKQYGCDLKIRAMIYLIVTTLIRSWMKGGFVPQNYTTQIDPIYTVPSYISHHIDEPLKVEDLAEFCGLSYPWFARKFHQIYGLSCKDYIEKVRIWKVEQYLLFTDCDLNYIRQHTGYSDCSHLVRDFRKFHNVTPVQFRRANQQKARGLAQFPQNY